MPMARVSAPEELIAGGHQFPGDSCGTGSSGSAPVSSASLLISRSAVWYCRSIVRAGDEGASWIQRPTCRSWMKTGAAPEQFPPHRRRLRRRGSGGASTASTPTSDTPATLGRMVNLTRIYTRTGDKGTTALGDMSRTAKTDPRIAAYADANEANAAIGVALALGRARRRDRRRAASGCRTTCSTWAPTCRTPVVENPEYPAAAGRADLHRQAGGGLRPFLEGLEKLR